MINILKITVRNFLVLLERVIFVSPKKTRFSSWYENQELEESYSAKISGGTSLVTDQPEWREAGRVTFSGVCVSIKPKVLMCPPSGFDRNRTGYRKAVIFTKNYQPLKYLGPMSFTDTLDFIRIIPYLFFRKQRSIKLSGRIALLGNRVTDNANYYHFLADVIGDMWYIRNVIKGSEVPDYYIVPFAGLAWQWDILRLCGLQDDQVIPRIKYDILSLEKLIIPVRDKGAMNLPPWLSSAIHQMTGWSPRTEKGERLIFVSRADATRRRVVNEALIRDRLVQDGFEVYTMDGMSFSEQQSLFSSASIICAPHGAALTNLVWCGPGAVVIDLLSEQHLLPCFKELAEQSQVIYYPCVCKKVEGDVIGIDGDIIVSEKQIEFILDVVASHSSP